MGAGETALKQKIGDVLEEAFPGQVVRNGNVTSVTVTPEQVKDAADKAVKRRMAREPSDTPLPLGDTESRRGADDRLRLLVERAERLEEEKQGIADDLKDVFAEMKAVGYDTKVVKQVMKLRKMQPADRQEQDALLDLYRSALGIA